MAATDVVRARGRIVDAGGIETTQWDLETGGKA
jgi:hypothetical protein